MNPDYALMMLISKQNEQIISQPADINHQSLASDVVDKWAPFIGGETVLDVGCGRAIAKHAWEMHGYEWTGATIGPDYLWLRERGHRVISADMHFVSGIYDVVFARHILEHSPVPAVALYAWASIAEWVIVVVPEFPRGLFHERHINVMPHVSWERVFEFSGLSEVEFQYRTYDDLPYGEYRYLLRRSK